VSSGLLCISQPAFSTDLSETTVTLKEGFEGQISENNIEIGIVNDQKKFRVR